jgi:hypothetical protein
MVDEKKGRKERLVQAKKMLDEVGKGLYRGQIEIKMAPWQVNWEYMEILIEQQEEMIALLKDIKGSLDSVSCNGDECEDRIRIINEIESADANTLKDMCKRAGLDQRGRPDALRARLYKYYKIG